MASIATFGLSKIEAKAVEAEDSQYKVLGMTYQDSCTLTQNEPEEIEHYAEECDTPIVSVSRPGKIILSFSIMDADVDTLVSLLGGNKGDNGSWNAPEVIPTVEMSIRVTPKSGMVIEIPRARVVAKFNASVSRSGMFLITVTATILKADGKAKVIATPLSMQ